MGNFEWVLREQVKTNGFPSNYYLDDFLVRSGLPEDADWQDDANAWGAQQTPAFKFSAGGSPDAPMVGVWQMP